jgi:hypothetical protein
MIMMVPVLNITFIYNIPLHQWLCNISVLNDAAKVWAVNFHPQSRNWGKPYNTRILFFLGCDTM